MATPNPKTITAANSVFQLTINGLYNSPGVTLQGYGVDAAFMTELADNAEVQLGVDGLMSAGWIPRLYEMTITLQANSPSILVFELWGQTQDAAREVSNANAFIQIPGIGRNYTFSNGVLKSFSPIPEVAKVLRPRVFKLTWNSVTPAAQ
jgi:hypothetical protein